MAHNNTIRHLSLDLWLTLIRSNPAFKPARAALLIKMFGIAQGADEVLRVFQEYDRLFNRINESTGRNLSRHEMLYIILAVLGRDADTVSGAALDAFFEEADHLFSEYPPQVPDDGVAMQIAEIKSFSISTSLLSNTAFITGANLREALPRLGFEEAFDFQIYSDELERSKPSAEAYGAVYNAAAQIRPLSRAEILHIGDNPVADYEGARRAGFKAILFNPEQEQLSRLLATTLCTPHLRCTT